MGEQVVGKASGILVVFSPHSDLTCYMPNVSLATLAGSLIENGHSVKIYDYGTTDEIERLAPRELREGLMQLYPKLMGEGLIGDLKKWFALSKLKGILKDADLHHRKRAHEVSEQLLEDARRENVDFIAYQGWMGQGMVDTIYSAEHVKKHKPDIKIILGGATVDQARGAIFRRTRAFDALAFGDGDETIVEFARYAEGKKNLSSVPNIIYWDGTKATETETVFVEDLDSLPLAVYDEDVYPAMKGDTSKIKIGVIDDSRGCIYRCYFCPHLIKSGNEWRLKSPERMMDEVKNLRRHGMTHWRKAGSNPPLKSGLEEAESYLENGLESFWTTFAHINQINPYNPKELETLKKAGLLAFSFGIEHGDPEMRRKYFNKAIGDNENIKRVLGVTMDSGIYAVGSFIYPPPFETEESTRKTLELIYEAFSNGKMSSPQFYPPGLFPESEWGRDPERFGFKLDRPEEYPEGYVLEALEFVLNRRLPPNLWRKTLPYSLNGMPFKNVLNKAYRFCKGLKRDGISINVPEEYVLFWHALDHEDTDIEGFSNNATRAVYTMDSDWMKDTALEINRNRGS